MDPYFRGQKKMNKSWVEGYYALYPFAGKIQPCILQISEDNNVIPVPVDPETVGQSIGWTDSTRQRIYEGDFIEIIYHSGMIDRYLIWADISGNCCSAVNLRGIKFNGTDYYNPANYLPWSDFYGIMLDPYKEIESVKIMGDIYNNPEIIII